MSIPINNIAPRVQYTAGAPQTVFNYPFPIFAATDLSVYQNVPPAVASDANDILVLNIDYTVTGVGAAGGGTIVLTVATAVGDIITIVRNMPEDRMNLYINGGLFTADMVNQDASREVMMNQQNQTRISQITPHYNESALVRGPTYNPPVTNADILLPLLPPTAVWRMNAAGTAIEAAVFGGGGSGTVVILPTNPNHIATFTDNVGTLHDSGFRIPLADGPANAVMITDGAMNLSLVPAATVFPAQVGSNRVINGDFQIWQRGAGGAASFLAIAGGTTQYTADRWQISVQGGGASAASIQTAGATSGSYLARVQRTAGNAVADNIYFATSLTRDMCIGCAGNVMTISFKARAGANYSPAGSVLTVQVYSGTGTNDISFFSTFTGQVAVLNQNVVLTGALQSFTLTTPALGAGVTQLAVNFAMLTVGVAGANDYFDITDVQLEIGAVASPFQRLSFAQQLANCLPFYQKSFPYTVAPAQAAGNNIGEFTFTTTSAAGANINRTPSVPFKVNLQYTVLAGAVLTVYSPINANALIYNFVTAANFGTTTTHGLAINGFYMDGTADAGSNPGNNCGIHWSVSNELL